MVFSLMLLLPLMMLSLLVAPATMGILGALAYSFVYLIIVIIVVVVIFWLLIAVVHILPPNIGWPICAVIIIILILLWIL